MTISKVGVLILGMLLERPMSPYEMAGLAESIDHRYWFSVAETTFYNDIRKFSKQGYLKGVPSKTGNRPEKMIYDLTELGRTTVVKSILDFLGSDDIDPEMFRLAILYLHHFDREEAKKKLEQRLDLLQGQEQRYRGQPSTERYTYSPDSILLIEDYSLQTMVIEIEIIRQLIFKLGSSLGLEPFSLSNLEGRKMIPDIDLRTRKRFQTK